MTGPEATGAASAAADPGPAPGAEEQARGEARLRTHRGRVVTAVVVAVIVLVVLVVALLGGFRPRKDQFSAVAVGSTIETGPYAVTVEKATVEARTYDGTWQVEVSGVARTTGDTTIAPPTGDSGFVFARARSTREVQASTYVQLGSGGPASGVDQLTPGLPPVSWTITFVFTRPPGDQLLVVVFDQEYTTPRILSDEMGWVTSSGGSTVTLPLQERPAG